METNNVPKRRALGRGLEELFNNEPLDYTKLEEKIISSTPKESIIKVKLNELHSNPYQPRQVFNEEALNELASSIKKYGVFQPIIIKKSIKGYEIVAGERRVKASKIAGLDEIPAILRDFDDNEMMEIALLENLQRENLNALEEAQAYKKLINKLAITQDELAIRLGKSRSHITNMLGLLNLPREIQVKVASKEISMGHARVLSKLNDAEQQLSLVNKIVAEDLSVRDLERLTNSDDVFQRTHQIKHHQSINSEYAYAEEILCDKLGTKVKIKSNKVEISFVNNSDLNRIMEIMHLDK